MIARKPSPRVQPALDIISASQSLPGVVYRNRGTEKVHKRWAVMVLLREDGMSLSEIAHYLGMNDHASVSHGLKRAEQEPAVQNILSLARSQVLVCPRCNGSGVA